jgi:hypothetical protein
VIKIPRNGNVPFAHVFSRMEDETVKYPAPVIKIPRNGNVPFAHVFSRMEDETVKYPCTRD